MLLSLIGGYLFIFLARVADVSLATMRTLMIVRGKGLIAAGIGFFEVMIYITALNKVVSGLDNPANLIVYALGFATGNFMGSYIEEKLAIGLTTVQIISHRHDTGDMIRNMGFGVTSLEGKGREGFKEVLIVSLPRKELNKLLNFIDNNDSDAFVTIMDTRASKGGYFKQTMKNK